MIMMKSKLAIPLAVLLISMPAILVAATPFSMEKRNQNTIVLDYINQNHAGGDYNDSGHDRTASTLKQRQQSSYLQTENLPGFKLYQSPLLTSSQSQNKPIQSYHWVLLLNDLRGGARYDDEDDYDDYDDQGYDDEEDVPPRRRPGPNSVPVSDPRSHGRSSHHRLPPSSSSQRRRGGHPPPTGRRPPMRGKRPKHWTQRMATKTLGIGSSVVMGTVKQTGKLAYNIAKPKKVSLPEINGLWRIDQQIVEGPKNAPNPRVLASVATITLDARRRVVIVKDAGRENSGGENEKSANVNSQKEQQVLQRPFQFTKSRLGFYKTEFVAPIFLVGDKPRWYGYRGTWQRKLADPEVIKFVGKIYIVRKQKFGKEKGKWLFGNSIGTFVARRRVQIDDEDEYDDDGYDDDEYDDVDDYDNDGDGYDQDNDYEDGGYDSDF